MSEWISYKGPMCPVEKGVLLSVLLNNGDILDTRAACDFDWNMSGKPDAIFKYRIVDEIKKFDIDDVFEPSKTDTPELTGSHSSYYDVTISKWTNPEHQQDEPVTICCNDIIEALGMSYAQGNVFKAQWRIAAAKQGKKKRGNTSVYDAEKSVFFSDRVLIQEKNQ